MLISVVYWKSIYIFEETKQLIIMKVLAKAQQIQKTIDKLNNQLEELKLLNNKNKDNNNFSLSSDAWSNDDTIRGLKSIANKLIEINLIK